MELKFGMMIYCKTKEESKEFIKEAYKQGFEWDSNFEDVNYNSTYERLLSCYMLGYNEDFCSYINKMYAVNLKFNPNTIKVVPLDMPFFKPEDSFDYDSNIIEFSDLKKEG